MRGWSDVPEYLELFDAKRHPDSPEAIVTQIVWACVCHLPSVATHLDASGSAGAWRRGLSGCGDLSRWDAEAPDRVLVHLEKGLFM